MIYVLETHRERIFCFQHIIYAKDFRYKINKKYTQ